MKKIAAPAPPAITGSFCFCLPVTHNFVCVPVLLVHGFFFVLFWVDVCWWGGCVCRLSCVYFPCVLARLAGVVRWAPFFVVAGGKENRKQIAAIVGARVSAVCSL